MHLLYPLKVFLIFYFSRTFASSLSKPVLPKRGDKEFEPAQGGPSNLQTYNLNRSRDAMFGALEAERAISKYAQLLFAGIILSD